MSSTPLLVLFCALVDASLLPPQIPRHSELLQSSWISVKMLYCANKSCRFDLEIGKLTTLILAMESVQLNARVDVVPQCIFKPPLLTSR